MHTTPTRTLVAGWWPGRLYYGWVILIALAFGQITSWGILYYGFSVTIGPMQADLGWSRATLTGAFSLALLVSGVTGVFVGRWVDRHGPRLLMTVGSLAAVLLLLAWANVDNLIAFYAIFVGLGATMAMILYEPAFAAIATWFIRGRARALTIITFIAGFASVIYIPLIAWLITSYGWRTALLILAALLAVLTIPAHALVLRRSPEDIGLLPDGATTLAGTMNPTLPTETSVPVTEAVRSVSFRWLTIGFCLAFFANVAATVHLIPYLTDHGYSAGFAASAAGAIGLFALPGRVIFTPLGARVSRRFVASAIFAVQAVALIVLVTTSSAAGVWGFVVLFGLGFGAITPARAALVADLYGRANYGSISGILAFAVTGARSLAPVAAGLLYGAFGGYTPVFWLLTAIAALASGTVLLLPDERTATR